MINIVIDASTLILLAKTTLLKEACESWNFFITGIVEKKSTIKEDKFDAQLIKNFLVQRKIQIVHIKPSIKQYKFQRDFNIASGEASSLVLAISKSFPLATDDGQTIKVCKILNIKFFTAIHFLIFLLQNKKINTKLAMIKLEELKKYGRYNLRIIADAIERIKIGR